MDSSWREESGLQVISITAQHAGECVLVEHNHLLTHWAVAIYISLQFSLQLLEGRMPIVLRDGYCKCV
jgi:hypothetical protein